MKKLIYIALGILLTPALALAQEGFKITAQTAGVPDGKMYLIYSRGGDTLATADMTGGNFVLTGKVDMPDVAYIVTADGQGRIPVMLENTEFTVTANAQVVLVEGGPMQSILNEFEALNASLLQERAKLEKQMQAAMNEQNQMKAQAIAQQFEAAQKKAQEQATNLLRENANTFVAAYIVSQSMDQVGLDFLKEQYGWLGDAAKISASGMAVAQKIAQLEALTLGHVAPNFVARTPEGDTLSLHRVKGKVKLIDFWVSWCQPCRQENPNVLKMYLKYQPKGLEIVGVSLDNDESAWKKAIQEDGLKWRHVVDYQQQIARAYAVTSIPHTVLLDENNNIVAVGLRGAQLQKKIAELLDKKKN